MHSPNQEPIVRPDIPIDVRQINFIISLKLPVRISQTFLRKVRKKRGMNLEMKTIIRYKYLEIFLRTEYLDNVWTEIATSIVPLTVRSKLMIPQTP